MSPQFLSRFDERANWYREGTSWEYGDGSTMPDYVCHLSDWPQTPLIRMFQLTSLAGKLAREAVDEYTVDTAAKKDHFEGLLANPDSHAQDDVSAYLSECNNRRVIAGSISPLFDTNCTLLQKEYEQYRLTKQPSALLKSLWSLAHYAEGYEYNEKTDKFSNIYDSNHDICVSTHSILSIQQVRASLFKGVAASLYDHVDMYLCESIPDIHTAELAGNSCMVGNKPVYISFKLSNDDYGVPRLLSCETLAQAVDRLLHTLPRFVAGFMFNCSSVASITACLPLMMKVGNP